VKVAERLLAGDVACVTVEGRLDAATVPVFEQTLQRLLADGQCRLVVDMSAVNYISSSGLRVLLTARRQARSRGGDVFLCCLHPRVREILEMVGFISVFGIYGSCDEAVSAFLQSTSTA
jgi:anti-sigma B factor antagonist